MYTQTKDGIVVVTTDSVVLTPSEAQIVRQLFANSVSCDADTQELATHSDSTVEEVLDFMRDLGVGSAE